MAEATGGPIVVVDASTLLRALDANDLQRATALEALTGAHARWPVTAPRLLVWEVGQVVYRKLPLVFGRTLEERHRRVDALLRGIHLDAPEDPLPAAHRTGELVERHAMTFYDAAYLELAERLGPSAHLLTEDERLQEQATRALGQGRAHDSARFLRLLARHPLD